MSENITNQLFEAASKAMAKCHAPYSKFPVGAALRTEDGRIYSGANIEIASFPEGWCAETTALAHFVMAGGGVITDVAVVAERMKRITPCGGCRQRLAEFTGPDTRLHLCEESGVVQTLLMGEIFPLGFFGDTLK